MPTPYRRALAGKAGTALARVVREAEVAAATSAALTRKEVQR